MNSFLKEIVTISKALWIWFICLVWIIIIWILSFYISFLQYIWIFLIIEFIFIWTYLWIKKIDTGTTYKWYKEKGVILLSLFSAFITFSGFMIYYYWSSQNSFWYTPLNSECNLWLTLTWIRSHANDLICIIMQWWLFWKLIGITITFLIILSFIYHIYLSKISKK